MAGEQPWGCLGVKTIGLQAKHALSYLCIVQGEHHRNLNELVSVQCVHSISTAFRILYMYRQAEANACTQVIQEMYFHAVMLVVRASMKLCVSIWLLHRDPVYSLVFHQCVLDLLHMSSSRRSPAWLSSLTYFLCGDGLATCELAQINCILFS